VSTEADRIVFAPPYTLTGSTMVAWSVVPVAAAEQRLPLRPGWRVVSVAGRTLALTVASLWDPHPEHLRPYREVIVSFLVRQGLRLYSMPAALYLDDPFHVELGVRHYRLPKVLDPELAILVNEAGFRADSTKIHIAATSWRGPAALLGRALAVLAGLAVTLVTRILPLVGTFLDGDDDPWIRARIDVRPELATGRSLHCTAVTTPLITLRPFFAALWSRSRSTIGAPAPLPPSGGG
jgi:hypothetical protein